MLANRIFKSHLVAKVLLVAAVALSMTLIAAGPQTRPGRSAQTPFEGQPATQPAGQIDKLVFANLQKLGIEPANLCSDEVFVRRVFLDCLGTLPTAKEAQDFITDKEPRKRAILIDRLLERDEFSQYWAMKWCDVLRVKAEFPINLWPKAAHAYHAWIRAAIRENRPYDQFARGMLLAAGSNFYVPEANFYRAMQNKDADGIVRAVALTFMGSRAEKWPKQLQADAAVFFSQVSYKPTSEWKEEIVYLDPNKPVPAGGAALPDGTVVKLADGADWREPFVGWLTSSKNPYFARAAANRAWCWLLGRGIIHEADDLRLDSKDNPPVNQALLDYLQQELVGSKYDLQHIYRLILNSSTYQLSSIRRSDDERAEANFAFYPLRQMEAEVLLDALCQISGTTEKYSSAVPEPFTYIPEELRTVFVADGTTTSSVLELFGRPARDTGLMSERNTAPSASQRLHLLNSSHVQKKIEQGRKLLQTALSKKTPRETAELLYLTVLSRYPTADELRAVVKYQAASGARGYDMLVDLVWAMINSDEFVYKH